MNFFNLLYTVHKQRAMGSSLQEMRERTKSVNELDLEDTDEHIRKKSMNCPSLKSLTCTDQCSYLFR